MNEEQIKKALDALIDDALQEIEEFKKSRFSAAEIKIEGPGDGIAGKPSDGDLHAKKAEDDKDEDDKDDDKDMDKGENNKADPGPVHHSAVTKGENNKADPGPVHHSAMSKKEDDKDEDKKKDKDAKGGEEHEKKERKAIKELSNLAGMDKADMDNMGYMQGAIKKSQDEVSDLMKSYIDTRVQPLEQKLSAIYDLVNKIADQPVASKGVTARMQPLTKSADEGVQPLNKSEVSAKLFELKKSGTQVDSLDVTKAELGQELQQIVKKYNLA